MKVMKNVVVTAAVMAVMVIVMVNGVPRREGRGGRPPCNIDEGPSTITNLTQELCTQTNKTKCQANLIGCMKQLRSDKTRNSSIEDQFVANITACAQQLGYNITTPNIQPRPHISEDRGSGELDNGKCHHGPERFFPSIGLTQTQLLPMLRCLMTRNGDLVKLKACINQ